MIYKNCKQQLTLHLASHVYALSHNQINKRLRTDSYHIQVTYISNGIEQI